MWTLSLNLNWTWVWLWSTIGVFSITVWTVMRRFFPTIGILSGVDLIEIEGFLNNTECDAWVRWIQRHPYNFFQSKVDRLWGTRVVKTHRNSQHHWLAPAFNSDTLSIVRRARPIIYQYLRGSLFFLEHLQVVRYGIGGYFRPHYDERISLWRGRYGRDATLLIYLNDDYTGGETVFPRLGKTVIPKKGKAILFRNLDSNHRRILWGSYHEGRPITSGEKYILNLWIHKK